MPGAFRLIVCATIGICLPPAGAQDVPDLAGFWAEPSAQAPSGEALVDELPEGTVLLDDAGAGDLARGEFGGINLTERALEELRTYDPADELLVENTCKVPSVIFAMQAPFPMEIHQGRDLIVMQLEFYDLVRTIFLDGRDHPPADAPHTKAGHSVGHWEGDTLVVDTTHIASATFMNNGFNHSDDLRMVERFRLSEDESTLWLTQLYEDPVVFEGRVARYIVRTRVPGEYTYPYDCDPSYGR